MLDKRQPRLGKVPLIFFIDRVRWHGSPASQLASQPDSPWHSSEPVREELFSVERLEEHARSLAVAQKITSKPARGHALADRLEENGVVLLAAYRGIAQAIDERRSITPAAEWLVDNYYLVERHIREIRSALPPGYYRQLPKLAGGPFAFYPRVFGIAWAFVAHTDSHFDTEMLCRFVAAYQDVQPLTIGELWAVAITLRIVLIENLRRIAERITHSSTARLEADGLADRLLGSGGRVPEPVSIVLADSEGKTLPDAFAVQLVHRLRDQDPRINPALTWLDEHLAAQGSTVDTVVRDEHQRQGTGTVTVRNIITSLRMISGVDWLELLERISLVDQVLAAAGSFREMDFPTRDLYRRAIEELALGANRSELDVARDAVLAAGQAEPTHDTIEDERRGDTGYHLFTGGRPAFEARIGFRPPLKTLPERLARRFGIGGYVGLGITVAALLLALPLVALYTKGFGPAWLIPLGFLGLIPAVDVAVALVNRVITGGFGATLLPALDLRAGIPAHLRTVVAVPTMLTTVEAINAHIEDLEVHHLASPEGDMQFILLSDWLDAETEHVAGDEALLEAAVSGIAQLNRRYGPAPCGDRFLLLHRKRVWNAGEARWIGWERKRGKLHELNRLLRGATDTSFLDLGTQPLGGPAEDAPTDIHPAGVRYVITLDSDTRLPRDTVQRLIGKMAHPLNRPCFDARDGRVLVGYGVLQPRVTPSLPVGREGSLYQRIFSSMDGIDPYASAVSDVYQDLFGEGSYAGKGIYDIDAFEAVLAGRAPDSTLLSHDLFEGVFARAGLASDIEVVEDFPARYDVDAMRHHRWARGDWQLLPWILGHGPVVAAGGTITESERNLGGLPRIGRWKMLDNLRRTLSAPACVLALLTGLTMPFAAGSIWICFILLTILLPSLMPVISAIVPRQAGIVPRSHFGALGNDLRIALASSALVIAFIAHQAWLMIDAIARTLVRLYVTRRHLLEWVPAAQVAVGTQLDVAGFYRMMAGGVVIGALALPICLLSEDRTWLLGVPLAVLWAGAPALALWTSRSPPAARQRQITAAEARTLRLIARRTWRFFETFVTPADNMLPPDNFQEDPNPVVAHRTSPTNIGLYLLSLATARDFAWLGTADVVERLEATLETMGRLGRFRGHFYNWYDTQDLRPLDPPYVSTVDSGNLAGHLITLANACREWIVVAPSAAERLAGIADALDLAREAANLLHDGRRTQTVTWDQLDEMLSGLAVGLRPAGAKVAGGSGAGGGGESITERLTELAAHTETTADIAAAYAIERGDDAGADLLFWIGAVRQAIQSHQRDLAQRDLAQRDLAQRDLATTIVQPPGDLAARLASIEATARTTALEMGYDFLLDHDRKLLSIGYRVHEGTLDPSCYDLLASEARLASFIAIAKGDVPARHWFQLGRAVTPIAHGAALISWSGSMFEYLMPSLVMRAPSGSLIEQTNKLVVKRQIDYGNTLGLPWGISESAYNTRDLEFTYQYSNFGVPGLGLKRGLGENAVVAPYATALATLVDPRAAVRNFTRLASIGARGRYGFYEAIDYTPIRVPEGQTFAVVHAYMAHHQGMSIVAIGDVLLDGRMRTRFHAEPMVQATELLLQERAPRDVAAVLAWAADASSDANVRQAGHAGGRRITSAHAAGPATHLLSNGHYTVMLTASGSGYSSWRGQAVTRWREDATCDDWGSYIFLRDVLNDDVWSAGFQPTAAEPDRYEVAFNEDRAEFIRHDRTITTTMEVLVSAEDDAEVRRVTIANNGNTVREIEVTSYAELVLGAQADDVAHPAFMKLFAVTEYLANQETILATRRRRSPADREIWAAHLAIVDGEAVGKAQIETDRARFLGRGHDVGRPISVIDGRPLSNTAGTVIDPIFALRRRVRVPPGGIARIAFWTMVARSREAVLDLVDKHRDNFGFERAATLAWTQAQVQLHHLGIDAGDASLFQRVAGHLLYAGPTLRPSSDTILRGAGAQPGLWPMSISGDLPIVLLRIADMEHLDLARHLLKAHEYWRMKRLPVDLVILNERASSYVQDLQNALETMSRSGQSQQAGQSQPGADRRLGRIYVPRADLISADARALLISVARVVLVGQRGTLADQLDRVPSPMEPAAAERKSATPSGLPEATPAFAAAGSHQALEFFNGLGGFADDGREYVTTIGPGQSTPAPWINVIANPVFGFQVATEGGGYTWSANSRENQLTPWSNDPVSDRPGEAFYVRDEESGEVWCPTALPIRRDAATYVARHGWGYSRFEHDAHGIAADLLQYVPTGDPIKISRLTLMNMSGRPRRLSVTAYVEWVLGPSRTASAAFVSTEIDPATGAMFARNLWQPAFASRVAFADLSGRQTDWTGDRREFIGRDGTLRSPVALRGDVDTRSAPLSNTVGAGLDPCAALRTVIVLPAGGTAEINFFLGQGANAEDARGLISRYREADLDAVLADVGRYWDSVLGAVQVKTPDRAMDIMLNGWLLYQTLACRIWARSAFYQASGAYGFRDQLQDGMALAAVLPAMTREHLPRAAARQFLEGDVQHWWLPHTGQGVRTRISDDRPWLAYAVAHYVGVTGDTAVLDEVIPFLEGQLLTEAEHDSFFLPTVSDETGTLFEHCARALDASLAVGVHGLPLMGTGDWNDGMNRIGEQGKGESVWLGWLLYTALSEFVPLADARQEVSRATAWRTHAAALRASLEREAWDGDWYRRAWFDDGTPVGSATDSECRIDSISQSWAVISGAADRARAAQAMTAVERELIRPVDQLALLFTPAFDKTPNDPGYIKGYPPGIRENGGQYTHAALWSIMAFAALGEGDKASGLFSLLNPINHARTRSDVHRYKVEPYVVAADVYATAPHVGRGGWTWYTGSAGWMQRSGVESILGARMRGDVLMLDPCIPKAWPGFSMTMRHRSARYEIVIENPDGVSRGIAAAEADGVAIESRPLQLKLLDDGATHHVLVRLG